MESVSAAVATTPKKTSCYGVCVYNRDHVEALLDGEGGGVIGAGGLRSRMGWCRSACSFTLGNMAGYMLHGR